MNAHTMTRGFIGMIAIGACALALTLIPGVSEAYGDARASSSTPSTKGLGNKNVDATCIAEAIEERENALMDAWTDMSSSTLTALTHRRDGLTAAWGKTIVKERTAAIVKVWKDWRTEKKTITAEFRNDRKAAWEAFKKTAKAECKVVTPKDENLEKAASDSIAI